MTDEDKTSSAWFKVPTWDGSPETWRSFDREMQWWISSLDNEATKKYNLAARWLLRQTGVARQSGEEFSPKDLEYPTEIMTKDPDGVKIIVVPEDPLSGLTKLLKALEGINGRTASERKGELRNLFYLALQRRPGEPPADFMSRFRSVMAELKQESIELPKKRAWLVPEGEAWIGPLAQAAAGDGTSEPGELRGCGAGGAEAVQGPPLIGPLISRLSFDRGLQLGILNGPWHLCCMLLRRLRELPRHPLLPLLVEAGSVALHLAVSVFSNGQGRPWFFRVLGPSPLLHYLAGSASRNGENKKLRRRC